MLLLAFQGKCRSYTHVADEISSWVRLIMTLGHKESSIAVVFLKGQSFNQAWKGKSPEVCGNRQGSFAAAATAWGKQEPLEPSDGANGFPKSDSSSMRNLSSKMDAWVPLHRDSVPVRFRRQSAGGRSDFDGFEDDEEGAGEGGDEYGMEESNDAFNTARIRSHRLQLQEKELAREGMEPSLALSPQGGAAAEQSEAAASGEDEGEGSLHESSVRSIALDDVPLASPGQSADRSSQEPSAAVVSAPSDPSAGPVATPVKRLEAEATTAVASPPADASRDQSNALVAAEVPTEETFSAFKVSTKLSAERRRLFQEAVQERMASVLKWNRLPQLFMWDEGVGQESSELNSWLSERYLAEKMKIKVPKLCEILVETCIPFFRNRGDKIVCFDDFLENAKTHVRSLMPPDLSTALNWVHRMGVVLLLPGEGEAYVSAVEESAEDARTAAESLALRSPLRSLGAFPQLCRKIVLDISWFYGEVIGSITSPRDVLPPAIQHQLPWGDKDYLLSQRQLTALCESALGPVQKRLNSAELICVLENMLIGAWCSSSYMFIPARVTGDKMRWLRQRQITNMPLSQFGVGAGNPVISSVLGRRFEARSPFLIPAGLIFALQSLILQQYARNEWSGASITCWERGVGIVIEVSQRDYVCAIIEQIPCGTSGICHSPNTQDGMQNDAVIQSSLTDIMVWGEGENSTPAAVKALMLKCTHLLEQSVLVVLSRLAKSDSRVPNSGDAKRDSESYAFSFSGQPKATERSVRDDAKFLAQIMQVRFLRPGCILQTLTLSPKQRQCAVFEDDSIVEIGVSQEGSSRFGIDDQSPVLVCCDHMQPRLCMGHLHEGYVLSDSPGGGRAMLRAVSAALERTLKSPEKVPGVHLSTGRNYLDLVSGKIIQRETVSNFTDFSKPPRTSNVFSEISSKDSGEQHTMKRINSASSRDLVERELENSLMFSTDMDQTE
jgi:hypothetical protein